MFSMCLLEVLVHVVQIRTKAAYISEITYFVLSMVPIVLKGYFFRAYFLTLRTTCTYLL